MVKTVCGSDIDYKGFLVVESDKPEQKKKPVVLQYSKQRLYFCEESCKKEFLNASDKIQWIENHK
ncbi:MAG: hypothetical protein ACFFB2_19890 [Promethearchaeota archaeon]